ncbi:MAG TPA: hypothetical protein VJ914_04535 [Pseudonocardiaceae bacterium]|nr:hypothetical protein [Pseudonocardiaceae bacterium]
METHRYDGSMLTRLVVQLVQQVWSAWVQVWQAIAPVLSAFVDGFLRALFPGFFELARFRRKLKPSADELLESRLSSLAQLMQQSSSLISEVEAALILRQTAVEKLKLEAETAQRLAELSKDQSEAVARLVQAGAEKETKKSIWYGIVGNAVFFGLGILVSLWIGH